MSVSSSESNVEISSSKAKESKSGTGLLALLIKLGGKVSTIIPKLLKSVKVVKVGMAAATAASYSYMFTWKFALAIMLMIGWHEYGHLCAMKWQGMKTKGFYFLPFLGGVAVGTSDYPDRKGLAIVALMGPIFGLVLSAIALALYQLSADPLWAAIAGWWAFINLFNLLPILPLDGGKVLSAIALSIHSKIGLWILTLGLFALVFIGIELHISLFAVLLIAGSVELFFEYKRESRNATLAPMNSAQLIVVTVATLGVAGLLWAIILATAHVPDASLAKLIMH